MRMILGTFIFVMASSSFAQDDAMLIWSSIEAGLKDRNEGAVKSGFESLAKLAKRSADDKSPIVRLVGASGTEQWVKLDLLSTKTSALLALLKKCDDYQRADSLEDLMRTCAKKNFDGLDWSRSALPIVFSEVNGWAYLDEDLLLKPFLDHAKSLSAKKEEAAKIAEQKHIEDEKRLVQEAELAREKGKKTPAYWSKLACESHKYIKYGERSIAEEHEAGKISGVVDKSNLHGSAKMIQFMTDRLDDQKKEFKRLSGKEWTAKDCKQ